jgi:hypothetical protein
VIRHRRSRKAGVYSLLLSAFASSAYGAESETAPSLSLPANAPQAGGSLPAPSPAPAPTRSDEPKFQLTGYLHAPLRFSWGPPTRANPTGTAGTQLRTPPLVPDANYIDYRYTSNLAGPWSELNFNYGNALARATVQLASYNLTDAGYRRLEANLGINQAFVALNPQPVLAGHFHVSLTVGGFSDRYGAAGRYDSGKYETFLFGRTHVVGETLRLTYDLSDDVHLSLEHGFGGKLEPTPFFGAPTAPRDNLSWNPYPGAVAQESTFVHHAHAGLLIDDLLIGAHLLHAFANDNERAGSYVGARYGGRPLSEAAPRLLIYGADLKLVGSVLGDGYLGYAHLDARNADYMGDTIEVLHSFNGWQLHDNYFGKPGEATRASGKIDSVLFQHSVDLSSFASDATPLLGHGNRLLLGVFGMFNAVSGTPDPAYDVKKLKWGADILYAPLDWLAFGGRFDRVSPKMSDPTQTFSVISPRVVVRSSLVSHEQIAIQYHRYFYGSGAMSTAYPYNTQVGASDLGADRNAAQISATLWF